MYIHKVLCYNFLYFARPPFFAFRCLCVYVCVCCLYNNFINSYKTLVVVQQISTSTSTFYLTYHLRCSLLILKCIFPPSAFLFVVIFVNICMQFVTVCLFVVAEINILAQMHLHVCKVSVYNKDLFLFYFCFKEKYRFATLVKLLATFIENKKIKKITLYIFS